MSELKRGGYTLSITDSTWQFRLVGGAVGDRQVGADSRFELAAKDIIALMEAYLKLIGQNK